MEELDTDNKISEHREILERLEVIEKEVRSTRESMVRMQKLAFWRLVILLALIILPALALPFFMNSFIDNYVGSFEGLL